MAARRARTVIAAAVIAALAVPAAAGASGPEQRVLPEAANGERAIAALGEHLPDVAAAHDRTAAQLRSDLRSDKALWVDVSGRLYYVDPVRPAGPSPTETSTTTDAASTPSPDEAFTLHSRPGASRVIYLDFDGHTIENTAWNGTYGTPTGSWWAEAYDADGDPGGFSTTEREVVVSVWQRVAEDFAPFDVDVTTADPGAAAIDRSGSGDTTFGTRVLVTSETTMQDGCGCGGVAYVGVYDRTSSHAHYQPAWVFTEGVGTGPHNVAEAASHEAGHNLGLDHDGHGDKGYYTGHEGWAPIMGVGYYEPITQWSRGEYDGATNGEDDFAVMTRNGAPHVADDHGTTATPLSGTASGVISSATDTDTFTFTLDAPATATITVAPAVTSPNLDARLEVLGGGTIVGADDPVSTRTSGDLADGLGAELVLALDAGTYTAVVDGVGRGTASTGYTDYGSVGRYTITLATVTNGGDTGGDPGGEDGGTEPEPEPDPLTAPSVTAALTDANTGTVTVSWAGGSGATSYQLLRETQHPKRGHWTSLTTVTTLDGDASSHLDSPGSGTHRYAVVASDGSASDQSAWSSSVSVTTSGSTGGGGGKGGPKKTTTQRIP